MVVKVQMMLKGTCEVALGIFMRSRAFESRKDTSSEAMPPSKTSLERSGRQRLKTPLNICKGDLLQKSGGLSSPSIPPGFVKRVSWVLVSPEPRKVS